MREREKKTKTRSMNLRFIYSKKIEIILYANVLKLNDEQTIEFKLVRSMRSMRKGGKKIAHAYNFIRIGCETMNKPTPKN